MTLVDKRLYDETLELMRGHVELPPAHARLAAYAEKLCGVRVVNIAVDMLEMPMVRPRLRILALGVWEARGALYKAGNHRLEQDWTRRITKEYLRLTGGHELPHDAPLTSMFTVLTDFQQEVEEEIVRAAVKEAVPRLQRTYGKLPIWRMENCFAGFFVFFDRREDVDRYKADGSCAQLVEDYTAIVRRYDEFGLYEGRDASVVFDSKQRVDEEFEGNLFYYYR